MTDQTARDPAILGRAWLDGSRRLWWPDGSGWWRVGHTDHTSEMLAEEYGGGEVLLVSPAAVRVLDAAREWRRLRSDRSIRATAYLPACRELAAAVDALDGPADLTERAATPPAAPDPGDDTTEAGYTPVDLSWGGTCLCEDKEAHGPDCRQGHRADCPPDCFGVLGCPRNREGWEPVGDDTEAEFDAAMATAEPVMVAFGPAAGERIPDWELALLGDREAQAREDYWQRRGDEVTEVAGPGWDRGNVERIIAMVAGHPALGASGDGDQLRALLADRDRLRRLADGLWATAGETETELAGLRCAHQRFAAELGFGDDVSEPAASLADMLDPIVAAMAAAGDHEDCPVHCELCGETLAATTCQRCNGLGDIGSGAYEECPECAGVGRIHEGCAERSYADLVAERVTLAMRCVEMERQRTEDHAFIDTVADERDAVRAELADLRESLAGCVWMAPGRMSGDPCIGGTRIPAGIIAGLAADGLSGDEIRTSYPSVSDAGVAAAVAFAGWLVAMPADALDWAADDMDSPDGTFTDHPAARKLRFWATGVRSGMLTIPTTGEEG